MDGEEIGDDVGEEDDDDDVNDEDKGLPLSPKAWTVVVAEVRVVASSNIWIVAVAFAVVAGRRSSHKSRTAVRGFGSSEATVGISWIRSTKESVESTCIW